nr:hypothetical protein GCM10020063_090760 [Dactylosporangium thailandense]
MAAAIVAMVGLLSFANPSAALAAPGSGQSCPPDDWYSPTSNHGGVLFQLGPTYGVRNDTPEQNTFSVTHSVSGTASMTVNGSVSWKQSVIIEGVTITLGISVTASLTTNVSVTANVTVPANSIRYAHYGIMRNWTTGSYGITLPNCSSNTTVINVYAPWYTGYTISTSP